MNAPNIHSVALYAPHATYPISYAAKAAALGGHKVSCFLKQDISYVSGDHNSCYQALTKDSSIRLLDPTNNYEDTFTHLFVCWSVAYYYTSHDYKMLCTLMDRSQQVGALCHVWSRDKWQSLRGSLKYALSYPELFIRTRSIGYEEMPEAPNWHSVRARPYWVGGGPHPQGLHDASVRSVLYSEWSFKEDRRFKLAFGGNVLPEARTVLLGKIGDYLRTLKVSIVDDTSQPSTSAVTSFIRVYSSSQGRQLSTTDYYSILSNADFTLCFPGYTVWTNRPIEALLRGSIPLVADQEIQRFLDLPLKHMENCIEVKNNNWIRAVDEALNLKYEDVIRMRFNVHELKKNYLDLDVWARRLREKMGL